MINASHNPATDRSEGVILGLGLSVWVKIVAVTALMAVLFRFNLSRLFAKTNPYDGDPNWQHAMFIPLIGLYYLYVWREDLLRPRPPLPAGYQKWSPAGVWGISAGIAIAAVTVACALFPPLFYDPHFRTPKFLAVSLPWVIIVAGVCLFASAFVVAKQRDLLRGELFDRSMTSLWRLLGAWVMLNLAAWGMAFFVAVFVPEQIFIFIQYLLGTASAASLFALVWFRNSKRFLAAAERVIAPSATWFGSFIMLWGILFYLWGIWPGQNDFFKDVGMVITLFGVVLLLVGWRVMRVAWFPVVFLFCALPWPGLIYSWVAGPLQLMAAKVAVHVVQVFGVDAAPIGTKIRMMGGDGQVMELNVEEACAGLRSLMTFVSVAAAIAFLSARPLWQKIIIAFSAVPIAITCNVMRVSGQGLLVRYVSQRWSEGFAHQFAGLVMLIPGFFMTLLVCWLLDHLFIEEMDETERNKVRGAVNVRGPAAAGAPPGAAASAAFVPKPVASTKAAVTAAQSPPKKPARVPDGVIQIPRAASAGPTAHLVQGDGIAKPKPATVRKPAPAVQPASGSGTAQPAARPASLPVVRVDSNGAMKPAAAKSPVAPRPDAPKAPRPAASAPAPMPRKDKP